MRSTASISYRAATKCSKQFKARKLSALRFHLTQKQEEEGRAVEEEGKKATAAI